MHKVQSNTNVLKLLDFRVTKYKFSIVMELCMCTLEDLKIRRLSSDKHHVSEEVLIHIVAPIVSALVYMHSLKVVHFDIKPQNIFIAENLVPKLGDFGGSRFFNELIEPIYFGSPFYKAPEIMLKDKLITPRVDSFSFGATCCLSLYGTILNMHDPDFFFMDIRNYENDTVEVQNSNLQYRYHLGKERILPPISNRLHTFLKGLVLRNGKDRFSSNEMLHHPVIQESLLAWKLKENSETFKKRRSLLLHKIKNTTNIFY